MKNIQRSFLSVLIVALALSLTACSGKEASEVRTKSTAVTQESSVNDTNSKETAVNNSVTTKTDAEIKAAFTYSIIDEAYTEDGIIIKFPQLTKASDPQKADAVNKAIQDDIKKELDSLKNGMEDMELFSLDLKYDLAGYSNKVLSISYQGTSNFEKAAYPVNVYHTQNIVLDDVSNLPLKDIITIDSFFVGQFKSGMYSPTNEDLNLEKEGVNLKEVIEGQYSDAELISLFQKEDANYKLTKAGIILSVEVPHAIGDHLEMTINYELIKGNMIKSSPVWKD